MSNETKILYSHIEGENIDPDKEYQKMLEESTIEECQLALPKGYLSASQVSQYLKCPRQWSFRYVDQLRIAPTLSMVEGKAIHRGIEIGHREALKSDNTHIDAMLDAYNDSWKEEKGKIDWEVENEDEADEEKVFNRDKALLTLYKNDKLPKLQPVIAENGSPGIEKRFWVTIGKDKIPLMGYIDLIAKNKDSLDSEPEIIDHKVVSRTKSAEDTRTDLQLTIYSFVTQITKVTFDCLVKNKTPIIKFLSSSRGVKDWQWAQFIIQQVAESIAKGIYPPGSPGWWCSEKWCSYYSLCRQKLGN